MRFEDVSYAAGADPAQFNRIRDNLPVHIRRELIHDPRIVITVCVEKRKTEVVRYLDKAFRVDDSFICVRHSHIEIDRHEIPCFTHFKIYPRTLELGRHVRAAILPPTCETEACPVGAALVLPIVIDAKWCINLGLGEVFWTRQRGAELVLSPSVKEIFDAEGITGLKYERCEVGHSKKSPGYKGEAPYMARITARGTDRAADIHMTKYFCAKHELILGHIQRDRQTRLDDLAAADFQSIDRLIVKGKTYFYRAPRWIISRRVLELLLQHKVSRLKRIGFFLNTKFLPVITTPLTWPASSRGKSTSDCGGKAKITKMTVV